MSIAAMTFYWNERPDITDRTELMVLLALADFANDDGICFPGYETLSQKCRMSKRTAIRTVQRLQETGEIYVEERAGMTGPGGTTNRYILLGFINRNKPQRGDTASLVTPRPSGDILSTRGDTVSTRGDILTERGDIAVSPDPSIEPSIDPSIEPSGERTAAAAPLTFFDGTPVEVDKSRRPTFTSRTSTRKAAPFTPRWQKVIKSFRSVDVRKFDRDGMVSHGEGCVPLEIYCEFVPAQKLTDRIAEKIENALSGVPAEQIRDGFAEWIDRTRSKENDLDGMLDWAIDPSKRYSARNRGTSNGNQNRQQPATTWVAEWQEQQRNGPPARTLAELNRAAAENYPDITF
ncbi:MAG: helix-turn-helix domain-containing protein [Caldilineaceae bacterium]|nr:helix-turn-helix domain-containing protein [Caldilineaceae bacterium]